jgi:hypothetical protein
MVGELAGLALDAAHLGERLIHRRDGVDGAGLDALPILVAVVADAVGLGELVVPRNADETLQPKKRPTSSQHRVRYWLTSKPDPAFDDKCADNAGSTRLSPTPMTAIARSPSTR